MERCGRLWLPEGRGTHGRHVVARLVELGTAVRVLSRQPREASAQVTCVVGDLARDTGARPGFR